MIKVEKEVARPGDYYYIDPLTGAPQKATFTPETINYWHDQGQAMLSAGLSIPLPVEHQRDLKPMSQAERAAQNLRDNAGWVTGYKKKKIKDDATGQEVEALFSELEILDDTLAKKLPHTIRWTSPWISSFTDGNGKKWDGVISHLALTTRPRIIKQQPFPTIDAAMSLAATLPTTTFSAKEVKDAGFGFSRAGVLKRVGEKFKPLSPLAFSLYSGIGFAEDLELKKEEKKGHPSGEGNPAPEMSQEESLVDPDGDISIYSVLEDLLDAVGIPIPAGTNAENFHQRLYKAAMDSVKGKAKDTDIPEAGTPPAAKEPPKAPVVQEQPPLYMSLEQAQALTDPTQRQMALSIVALHEENKKKDKEFQALKENALEAARRARQARMDRVLKRLAPSARDKLVQMAAGAAFSLGDNGKVVDQLDATLAMLEDSLKDLPTLLTQDARLAVEQPHPQEYNGSMTEERRKELVKSQCRHGGVRYDERN